MDEYLRNITPLPSNEELKTMSAFAPLRSQLQASLELPPDTIAIWGELRDGAIELGFAAEHIEQRRASEYPPSDEILKAAEAKCIRTARAIAAYRAGGGR